MTEASVFWVKQRCFLVNIASRKHSGDVFKPERALKTRELKTAETLIVLEALIQHNVLAEVRAVDALTRGNAKAQPQADALHQNKHRLREGL